MAGGQSQCRGGEACVFVCMRLCMYIAGSAARGGAGVAEVALEVDSPAAVAASETLTDPHCCAMGAQQR